MENKKEYFAIVLGAGPSGHRVGELISSANKKVLVIDSMHAGGNCVNNACMPTKDMLNYVNNPIKTKNIKEAVERKNASINKIKTSTENLMKKFMCEFQIGDVKIIDQNKILLNDKEELIFENLIIATGCEPANLKIAGIEKAKNVFNSTQMQNLGFIPKKLFVVGAGPVGIELGYFYQKMGSEVVLLEVSPHILPNLDDNFVLQIKILLKEEKINLIENVQNLKIISENELSFNNQTYSYDCLFLAAGRKPVLPQGIENLKLEMTDKGYIQVNENFQTNIKNIFAVGDICGIIQQTHVAYKSAAILANYLTNKITYSQDYAKHCVPGVIYLKPEIAWVGTSIKTLEQNKAKYLIASKKIKAIGREVVEHNDVNENFEANLWCDEKGKVLGANIICQNAGELIGIITLAIQNNLSIKHLANTMFAHPTYSQVWQDLAIELVHKIFVS